ncbi:GILT-like protein 1 [Drosophila grimshawi]|uniref:GH19011 n=1 Tax=Drosophila grimshawi TaxID=7222 RepID=B4JHY3_DROGR|nr:GILT-like protein 1 [Drosophila grimshawi]EDV92891.1 GH19011 [Drosophila grimshawi]
MFKFITALCVLTVLSFSLAEKSDREKRQAEKLHITLLYESLCPDSRKFMHQLGPVHAELEPYINIELVPFGKSLSQQNGAIFHCQHGPAECEGNRLQSCVCSSTQNQAAQVKFVVCQMFAPNHANADKCANEAGILTEVEYCMKTPAGTKLQLDAELITKRYSPSFVPTIVYNHVFNQQLQDQSLRNFRATVCYLLRQQITLPATVCQ